MRKRRRGPHDDPGGCRSGGFRSVRAARHDPTRQRGRSLSASCGRPAKRPGAARLATPRRRGDRPRGPRPVVQRARPRRGHGRAARPRDLFVNGARGLAAWTALRAYFDERAAERGAQPRDDLISELVQTEVDGQRLTDDDIFAFLILLLPAGIETTYRSLGNLLFALLTHPDQLDEAVMNPELRASAIEEALRWETPLLMVPRRSVRNTRLGGVDVPAGPDLNVFIGSANRGERHYAEPDRFDVHRAPGPHMSFGSGPHTCLGMHLARMETRVALEAILERLHDLRLDPGAARPRIVGSIFRSPNTLPVCFTA